MPLSEPSVVPVALRYSPSRRGSIGSVVEVVIDVGVLLLDHVQVGLKDGRGRLLVARRSRAC